MIDNDISRYFQITPKSQSLYQRAKKVLPSGVSYGIRYFYPYPFYTAKAKGSKLYDVDGNEYIDFWLGHSALILGHCPPRVIDAVKRQLDAGTHFGTSHELEVKLAEKIVQMVPSAEMVRFTNSGTEANMYAVRLARTYTQKNKIAKFRGGWHGGYDALHKGVKPPYDIPESAGLTEGALNDTVLLPFNTLEGIAEKIGSDVAALIIEPVLGAAGCIPAETNFLKGLRELCDEKSILLIFDEVITGFRMAPGGAQEYFGVKPDITVLGKILGGGFPVGAFCGRKDIMERLDSSLFPRALHAFHGGTFAANPITMTAGLTTLGLLQDGFLINKMNRLGNKLRTQLLNLFEAHDHDVQVTGIASLFNMHFTKEVVHDADTAFNADFENYAKYLLHLIAKGIFLLPPHEGALSIEHSQNDTEKFLTETELYLRKHH